MCSVWVLQKSSLFFLFFISELIEPPPKTYTTKEKFEYFKPSVQVEMDHPDKGDTVTEVFVRGKHPLSVVGG